jgi:hypothetical protein
MVVVLQSPVRELVKQKKRVEGGLIHMKLRIATRSQKQHYI